MLNYFKKAALILLLFTYALSAQEILLYNSANSPLDVPNIYSVAVDSLNDIWIGGNGKFYKLDDEWTVIDSIPDSNEVGSIFEIEVTPSGDVWLTNELYMDGNIIIYDTNNRWNELKQSWGIRTPGYLDIVNDTTVYFILYNLWPNQLGEDAIGVFKNNELSYFRPDSLFGFMGVIDLPADSLLLTTWRGLALYDGNTWSFINPTDITLTFLKRSGDKIFAYNKNTIYEYYGNTLNSIPQIDSLLTVNFLSVKSVAVDNHNNLWVGTDNGRLIKYSSGSSKIFDVASSGIRDIAVDKDNNLWLITYEGCFVFNEDKIVTVKNETASPADYTLYQNYPNPFNPTTKIKFSIPSVETQDFTSQQSVRLIIYDVLGREIATLVNKKMTPGTYEATFNANNLPSGVYLYRIEIGDFVQSRKMLMLK